jgi:hypothetical protein
MADAPARPARKLADIVVIAASVISLGNAMWGPTIFTAMMHDMPAGDRGIGYNWAVFGLSGMLGVLSIFMTMRWPRFARIPLLIAGLMLVAVPFTYIRPHPLPVATSVVLGLAMLLALPFFGPMPAPRKQRTA